MWFYENYLIINKDFFSEPVEQGKKTLHVEAEQKLLGIIIDKDLNFRNHTKTIIKRVNQKLNALIRVAPFFIDFNRKVIFNSFNKGQFNYCSSI